MLIEFVSAPSLDSGTLRVEIREAPRLEVVQLGTGGGL